MMTSVYYLAGYNDGQKPSGVDLSSVIKVLQLWKMRSNTKLQCSTKQELYHVVLEMMDMTFSAKPQ